MQITKIEGIGPAYAKKLKSIRINTTAKLLERGATRQGRKEIEKETGISQSQVLEWINRADLMRISGVGEEYSDLLEAAGVDTVRELARRRVDSLMASLESANYTRNLVRRLPSSSQVARWIETAKSLPPVISY